VVLATTRKTDKVNLGDVHEVKRQKKTPEKAKERFTRNEAFIVVTEKRLLSEINKAINYLTKQSARMPKKSATRLQMREKLVNLRLEASVYYANEEMRHYDKAWDAWDRGGRKGHEPKLNESHSRGEWSTLAKDARTLLQEYPRSKNADVTLFDMGLAYNFLHRDKDAARIFSQLIAKYPNSQKAGDAYFALGDFYFDKSDFRNAMNNYKNALRFRQAKTYSWSLFKLGWCNYNLGKYPQSLAYWKATVRESDRNGKRGAALKDEALRDMVYGFAELKQVEPAIAYYRANGGSKYIGRFLLLLSDTFSDNGQYNDAIRVLKRFQQVAPYDEQAPDTQKQIIGLDYELGHMRLVWAELAGFPKLFGPGSPWGARHQSDKKLYDEVQQTIKEQILYYAKLVHKNGQKDDNRRLYAEALKGYTLFLHNYPKAREVAEVKYNMADIYYFTKNFRQAGQLYLEICLLGRNRAVIVDPKTNKSQNIHKEAADYMLDAYNQQYDPELKALLKHKPDFKKPPKPISQNGRNFIKACGYYQKWYPGEKKNIKSCDVFITEVFYRSGDKKMAMKYLWMLAKKYPTAKEGQEAVDELIPLYAGDKRGLARTVAELRKIPAYQHGKLGEKLKGLEFGSEVDLAKAEKDRCKRAAKYEALFKKAPNTKDSPALINNAAVDYVACGKIPEGIAAYMVVLSRFPKSDGAQDALLEVGKLHENRLELAAAANFFTQYAKRYPKDSKAIGSLAHACEIQAALSSGAAISTCLAFAGADQQNAKIIWDRMMRNAFSAGDTNRLVNLVKIYEGRFKLSAEERILAYNMVYSAHTGASAQAARQIISTFQKSGGNVDGEALRAVGGLAFRQANGEMGRFLQNKLAGGTVDALAASIQKKAAALARLQQAYGQVISTKDAYWGVAALYQLGYAREVMAKDLENPPAITGAAHADVVKQLAGDAKQARTEAAQFYQKAYQLVGQKLVYNEWAAKALGGIARISGKNITFDDLIVKPDFLGAEVPENIAQAVKAGGD